MQGRSNLVAFLLIGLVIGGLAGYMTRPEETAEIKLGPLSVEVRNRLLERVHICRHVDIGRLK